MDESRAGLNVGPVYPEFAGWEENPAAMVEGIFEGVKLLCGILLTLDRKSRDIVFRRMQGMEFRQIRDDLAKEGTVMTVQGVHKSYMTACRKHFLLAGLDNQRGSTENERTIRQIAGRRSGS